LQDFVRDFLEYLKLNNGEKPKYNKSNKLEMRLYDKWITYTNPKNLSKEEIKYLQKYGIELKRINEIQNVRMSVQDFVRDFLEYLNKNNGEKPKYNKANKIEFRLYDKCLTYTNPKNLSEEEVEYLKANGIELRRVNEIPNVRLELQDFVKEYIEYLKLNNGEKPKNNIKVGYGKERSLYNKWVRYSNSANLNKEEIEYLKANGIEVRIVNVSSTDDGFKPD